MNIRVIARVGLGCLLFAGAASAQDYPAPQPEIEPSAPEPGVRPGVEPRMSHEAMTAPGGLLQRRLEVAAGTGLLAYFDGGAPGTSGVWDVGVGYNATRLLTVEGNYLGAAGSNGFDGATVATIITGDLQVKPLMLQRFNPFVLGGAGWGAFSTTGHGPSDNRTFVLPLGVGAEYRLTDRLYADGRFVYHLTTGDQMGPARADLDSWALTGRVGAQF